MLNQLHPREKLVVAALSLGLIWAGWCLGGNFIWAVWGLLFAGALAALLVFVPLEADLRGDTETYRPSHNLRRLLRFPVFWLGLIVTLWITIAGFNPAWEWRFDSFNWWVEPREGFVPWLPQSVDAPIHFMNAWRTLLIFLAAWLGGCAAWVGVSRRGMRVLLTVTVLNACAVAFYGIILRMTGGELIFGWYRPGNRSYFGPWISGNQAAVFLYLHAATAGALAYYYIRRNGLRSGLPLLYSTLMLVFLASLIVAESRFGIVAAGVIGLVFLLTALGFLLRGQQRLLFGSSLAGVVIIGIVLAAVFKPEQIIEKLVNETENEFADGGLGRRAVQYEGNMRLIEKAPWLGLGPGSFRYFIFAERVAIADERGLEGKQREGFLRTMPFYAHSDWMHYVIELGILGSLPIFGILLWWLGKFFWQLRRWRAWTILLATGLALMYAHAVVDFPFSSPALLFIFVTLSVALLRLLEERHEAA